MEEKEQFVRFDWAMKRLLRDNIATARGEGRVEGRMQNARSLKQNDISVEIIAKSLGISAEEVAALS